YGIRDRHQRRVEQPRDAADDAESDKGSEHENPQSWPEVHVLSSRGRAPARQFLQGLARARVLHLAVVRDQRALLDVVVEIELELLVLREREDECREIAREEQA